MAQPAVMLVDNGSTKPAATLSLRAIADRLERLAGRPILPVSLQHSDRIPAAALGGRPAALLAPALRGLLESGQREFVTIPLFFGRSRALTSFIPQQVAELAAEFGPFSLRQADALMPLPDGDRRLARILADHVAVCSRSLGRDPARVIVVDHGSPLPEVTAVRARVTMDLRELLPPAVAIGQAVMERRQGAEYDFNGQLLGDLLDSVAARQPDAAAVLAMMFISPGRHAGAGGDIEQICAEAMARHPGLRVIASPLIGEHPLLVEILRDRLDAALAQAAA
jgi:sirohydrochlorin ferrochelatase